MEEYRRLREMIGDIFSMDAEEVTPELFFEEDLGADSLDLQELLFMLEEEFDVTKKEAKRLAEMKTVGEVADFLRQRR